MQTVNVAIQPANVFWPPPVTERRALHALLNDETLPLHRLFVQNPALLHPRAALPPLAALTEPRDASLISAEGTKLLEWLDGLPYRALPLPIRRMTTPRRRRVPNGQLTAGS